MVNHLENGNRNVNQNTPVNIKKFKDNTDKKKKKTKKVKKTKTRKKEKRKERKANELEKHGKEIVIDNAFSYIAFAKCFYDG